jgi:hypothetical protein
MAGIMALVNQKFGPQGQANFTLYPLAAQYPTTFNPIDVGSNNFPFYLQGWLWILAETCISPIAAMTGYCK